MNLIKFCQDYAQNEFPNEDTDTESEESENEIEDIQTTVKFRTFEVIFTLIKVKIY